MSEVEWTEPDPTTFRDLDALCICPECRDTFALEECDIIHGQFGDDKPDEDYDAPRCPYCGGEPIVTPLKAAYDDGSLPPSANQRSLFP